VVYADYRCGSASRSPSRDMEKPTPIRMLQGRGMGGLRVRRRDRHCPASKGAKARRHCLSRSRVDLVLSIAAHGHSPPMCALTRRVNRDQAAFVNKIALWSAPAIVLRARRTDAKALIDAARIQIRLGTSGRISIGTNAQLSAGRRPCRTHRDHGLGSRRARKTERR